MEKEEKSELYLLFSWVSDRFYNPTCFVTMLGYFIATVIIFGGVGIWWSVAHEIRSDVLVREELLVSILTFAWAVSGASFMDFSIGEKDNFVRVLPVYFGSILIVLTLISLLWPPGQYWFAFFTVLVASFVWWIANAENPKFSQSDPTSFGGGNPAKEVGGTEAGVQL
jgi:hypothetical protein